MYYVVGEYIYENAYPYYKEDASCIYNYIGRVISHRYYDLFKIYLSFE